MADGNISVDASRIMFICFRCGQPTAISKGHVVPVSSIPGTTYVDVMCPKCYGDIPTTDGYRVAMREFLEKVSGVRKQA